MLTLKNWSIKGNRVHGRLGKAHVITCPIVAAIPEREGSLRVFTANTEYRLS